MKRLTIHIIVLSFIFCSCSNRDLGDGYYYLPKYESIDIGYPDGAAIIYKSNQEYLYSDVKIQGDVIEVKSNSKYIIAKRNPLINRDKNTEILEYYLILKKNDSLIGPLTNDMLKKAITDTNVNLKFE
jgi:hypothetical protein